jgi:hypothetical protein
MTARISGISLIAAASLFWLSWRLMPGVGVTDAGRIFELVGSQRTTVMISIIAQLASAALYVPALFGIACRRELAASRAVRWGSGLLLLGAMGSAGDAIFHLVAYAMTGPGMDRGAMLPVMTFLQGPGLLLVAPFIASFFAGGVWLSIALARMGKVSWANVCAHAAAVAAGLLGGGLLLLACVSLAQAWAGAALMQRERVS